MKIITDNKSLQSIDTGIMLISIGLTCNICKRRTQTVTVGDIRSCAPCIHNLVDKKLKEMEINKVRRTLSAVQFIANNASNPVVSKLANVATKSTLLIKILSLFLSRK